MAYNKKIKKIQQAEADKNIEGLIIEFGGFYHVFAAKALVNIGNSKVAEALVDELKMNPGGQLGSKIFETLVRIGDVSVEPLIKLIKEHKVFGSSIHAVELHKKVGLALSKIGKPAIEPLLQLQKEDNDIRVQELIAKIFGEINDPCLIEPLLQILKNTKSSYAALALGNMRDESVIEPIIEAIKELKWYERLSISTDYINAFILIGEPAIRPLSDALKSDDKVVRKVAKLALKKINKNLKKGIVP